jgi:hypothetical protein
VVDYVFATLSTWVTPTVQIHKGEVWAANDPVVTQNPRWFTKDPTGFVRRSGAHGMTAAEADDQRVSPKPVEQATHAPGEKRALPRA